MVRRISLFLECMVLAAIQAAGVVSVVIGLTSAFAQSNAKQIPAKVPVSATTNPDFVKDFMAALPPSDEIDPDTFSDALSLFNLTKSHQTSFRILNGMKHGKLKPKEIVPTAVASFASECARKGGYVEPHDTPAYSRSLAVFWQRQARLSRLEICTVSPEKTLGALAVATQYAQHQSATVLVTLRPSFIFTQADLDREIENREASERRRQAARDQERAEKERWRNTIRSGTETGCGPVLRVNNEMVELVYYQTREPKWYRRNELWPKLFDVDGRVTCR
jgi:hypothetical protein